MALRSANKTDAVHPISDFQEYMVMLALETAPDSFINQEKTIRWAIRITPAVPHRSLQRAFNKLVQRHDSLRLSFVKISGRWKARILPKHPVGLQVEDLSHLTPAEQDETIQNRAKEPLLALSEALFEMRLFRCGPEGDVVLTRLNHAVGDGYSVAIVIEDILRFLLVLPVKGTAPGHADFMHIRNKGVRDRKAEKDRYWQEHLLPLPKDLNIGRAAKGLEKHSYLGVGATRRLDGILDTALAKQVLGCSQTSGVSVYSLLYAAFAEAICDLGKADEVLIKTAVSRHVPELMDFVGADVQSIIVKYKRDTADLMGRAKWVSKQVANGIAHLPTDAFDDDGVIGSAFESANLPASRFIVHNNVPKGRMKSSPFNLSNAIGSKTSIGPFSIERFDLTTQVETNFELMLLIDEMGPHPTASLIANAEGYDEDDLKQICQGICRQLRHYFDQTSS